MKKNKIYFYSIFLLILGVALFQSCSNETTSADTQNIETGIYLRTNSNEKINYQYDILYEEENRLLKVSLEKEGKTFQNRFTYLNSNNNTEIFTLSYSYNNENPKWKYGEQNKAIEFSNKLKDYRLNKDELEILNFILDDGYSIILYEVNEKKYDVEIFSLISYLKAAVSANLRMKNENSNFIRGTISPSFLIGKSNFIFQEDFIIDVNLVKNNITLLENSINQNSYPQDLNLVNYFKETSANSVTFDVIYSFYYPNELYLNHINYMYTTMHAGDCSSSCWIGCGSDLGCCGNYSGCCYYSHTLCLIHDIACTNCDKWHCGSGCVPDTRPNRTVKFLMG